MSKLKIGVFIGRFAPFHRGHFSVVEEAMKQFDELVIVIGSANAARSTRNPLTAHERMNIIHVSLPEEFRDRVRYAFVPDHMYNLDRWLASVQSAVFNAIHSGRHLSDDYEISLIGHNKDHTSFYLDLFPQWESVAVDDVTGFNSTFIRNEYYKNSWIVAGNMLNDDVMQLFDTYMHPHQERLSHDFAYEGSYEEAWGYGPHITCDAAVVQSGHILLIQRGSEYGHGLWALPGGFLDKNETIADGVIRELREETKIKVPEKVLRGSIVKKEVYDDPHRSNRSRIITNAYSIRLADGHGLPKIKGSDDAQDAKWVPLADVARQRDQMFEDHYDIIEDLVGF